MTKQAVAQPPVSYHELGWFLAVFMAAIAAIIAMGGSVLWLRQPWLDERCCTLYAIDASNPIQVVSNVVHGDVAPPLLHLIVWSITRVTGTATPVLRSIPLLAMGVAFLFVYLALRRRFGFVASGAGILSLATQGLIVEHAFEIRFYAFWVMFCAMYAWSLDIDTGLPSRRRDIAVALFSVCICLIHWFGIISLGGMALAVVLAHGGRWRQGLRLVAPSLAGVATFVVLTPLLVTQARTAGSLAYWPPLSLWQIEETALTFLAFPLLVLLTTFAARRFPAAKPGRARALLDPSLAALIGSLAMPVALVFDFGRRETRGLASLRNSRRTGVGADRFPFDRDPSAPAPHGRRWGALRDRGTEGPPRGPVQGGVRGRSRCVSRATACLAANRRSDRIPRPFRAISSGRRTSARVRNTIPRSP